MITSRFCQIIGQFSRKEKNLRELLNIKLEKKAIKLSKAF